MKLYENMFFKMSQKGDKFMRLWEISSPSKKNQNSLFPSQKHKTTQKQIGFFIPDRTDTRTDTRTDAWTDGRTDARTDARTECWDTVFSAWLERSRVNKKGDL